MYVYKKGTDESRGIHCTILISLNEEKKTTRFRIEIERKNKHKSTTWQIRTKKSKRYVYHTIERKPTKVVARVTATYVHM